MLDLMPYGGGLPVATRRQLNRTQSEAAITAQRMACNQFLTQVAITSAVSTHRLAETLSGGDPIIAARLLPFEDQQNAVNLGLHLRWALSW